MGPHFGIIHESLLSLINHNPHFVLQQILLITPVNKFRGWPHLTNSIDITLPQATIFCILKYPTDESQEFHAYLQCCLSNTAMAMLLKFKLDYLFSAEPLQWLPILLMVKLLQWPTQSGSFMMSSPNILNFSHSTLATLTFLLFLEHSRHAMISTACNCYSCTWILHFFPSGSLMLSSWGNYCEPVFIN